MGNQESDIAQANDANYRGCALSISLTSATRQPRKWASVENQMNIHRMECAETPVLSKVAISIQLSYRTSTSVLQRVNATVNY